MSVRLFKIAVVYLLAGASMGLVMGITRQFQFAAVHAHVNLLGWVSLALAGVIYDIYPEAAETRLAHWHFWLHNLGLPVFMVSLFLLLAGNASAATGVAIGATVTLLGIAAFVINLMLTLRSPQSGGLATASRWPPSAMNRFGRTDSAQS